MAEQKQEQVPDHVSLPAPTAWPFITAAGLTLLAAGLVTQAVMSVVGLILAIRGAVGWFRDVLPVEQHELVRVRPLEQRARPIAPASRAVLQLPARGRRPPCSYSRGDSSLFVGHQGRHSWRDCDGGCCLCVWCHCAPQHLVSD